MTDLSTVQSALASINSQVRAYRASIEANRRTREELAAAPLPLTDVLAIMEAGCDFWASMAPNLLARSVAAIATRPGKAAANWGAQTPLLPTQAADLAPLLAGLLASELKTALGTAIGAMEEIEGAGAPWSEREATLAQLDAAIEADESALAALKAQVEAAGLRWPGSEIF
jgi:hypothetical protein